MKSKKGKTPRARGEFGFSVVEAGKMIGLSVNASYAAVKLGQIPTVKMGGLLIVPRAAWLRKLGIEDARTPPDRAA